jgi:hypothetical protein
MFGTEARATASAFCTSKGRFIGAGVNFGLAGAVAAMGTLGTPIALTSIAFAIGLLIIPFARETRGETLPSNPEKTAGIPTSFIRALTIMCVNKDKNRGTFSSGRGLPFYDKTI